LDLGFTKKVKFLQTSFEKVNNEIIKASDHTKIFNKEKREIQINYWKTNEPQATHTTVILHFLILAAHNLYLDFNERHNYMVPIHQLGPKIEQFCSMIFSSL
jgi:hypothetical protein